MYVHLSIFLIGWNRFFPMLEIESKLEAIQKLDSDFDKSGNLGTMLWFKEHFCHENWQKVAFWLKLLLVFVKFWSEFFLEKRQLFRRKLAKLANKCDHNIDPYADATFDSRDSNFELSFVGTSPSNSGFYETVSALIYG
jgi:hypothetical protein